MTGLTSVPGLATPLSASTGPSVYQHYVGLFPWFIMIEEASNNCEGRRTILRLHPHNHFRNPICLEFTVHIPVICAICGQPLCWYLGPHTSVLRVPVRFF